MAGITKVEVKESVEELHELLRKQKATSNFERIQALEIKGNLSWESFVTLDKLREFIRQRLEKLNTSIIASITGWGFILDALFVSGLS